MQHHGGDVLALDVGVDPGGPAVDGLRLAEEEARHVEDVAPHVGEDELLELGQERLVREELEARRPW